MVTSAWGLDFAHLAVWVGGDVLWQNHLHTDLCVHAWECSMPPGLLWVSLGCVTCRCHGDASAKGGRAEVTVLHVGAKSSVVKGPTVPLYEAALTTVRSCCLCFHAHYAHRNSFVAAVQICTNWWTCKRWHANTHPWQLSLLAAMRHLNPNDLNTTCPPFSVS